jgi:hypothetical protein
LGAGSLGATIEGIFTGKGYTLRRSSIENKLLVMVKGEEVLSIGYSDLETSSTQDEFEMFISISESEGATDTLFISPARIQRDLLGSLRGKGVQVWDRTALVLAIGENELRKAALDSVEEWDAEDTRPEPPQHLTPEKGMDPVAELRRSVRELSDKGNGSVVTKVAQRPEERPPMDRTANGRAIPRSFPEQGQRKAEVKAELQQEVAPSIPASPTPEQALLPPPFLDQPLEPASKERMVVPLRVQKEDAANMAPGSVKDLQLVYRPYLLLEMSYMIRSRDGSVESERKGAFMVDLIDRSVIDLPSSALSGIAPGERMVPGSQLEELGAIRNEEARRAVAESIRVRDHLLERKVHDGMMSTIFRETESTVVDGSIRTEGELAVLMPVWKGRLSFGSMTWIVDGFAGTQRRVR